MLLRSVDYRDADRIVTLLTENFGKIAAIARGARRSQRRFGGALQPYVVMHAEYRPGRGDLAHLERVSVDRSFLNLLRNLEAIGAAGAALAVVRERLPDHEPEPAVFAMVTRCLEALDAGAPTREAAVTLHIQVLAELGFAPTLDRCVDCGKVPAPGRSASFDAGRGGIVCRACGGGRLVLSSSALRRWVAAQSNAELALESWPEAELMEIREALAFLDAAHATASVRDRSSTLHPVWEGRIS